MTSSIRILAVLFLSSMSLLLLGSIVNDEKTNQLSEVGGHVGDKYYDDVIKKLNRRNPRVVLIGNSMLGEAISQNELTLHLETPIASLWVGGASSAWWYLVVKNIIPRLDIKPDIIAIFFRDDSLTRPHYRISGKHRKWIDSYSEGSEEVLNRIAYRGYQSLGKRILTHCFDVLSNREFFKKHSDDAVKRFVGRITGVESLKEVNALIEKVFSDENMDGILVHQRQVMDEKKQDDQFKDYVFSPDDTFLEPIVKSAEDNGIRLVFVRVKRRRDLVAGLQPSELLVYMDDLEYYLAKHDVGLVDFTNNQELQLEHFGNGDHLNRELGRVVFTSLFADELRDQLAQ